MNTIKGCPEKDIQEQYGDLFNGIGQLKGYKLHLNIDESVRLVAQSARTVPFPLR